MELDRGSIYFCDLSKYKNFGSSTSVQNGNRPVVIISNYFGNLSSGIVMVCPFTTKIKDKTPNIQVKPIFKDGPETQVLSNQIFTISKELLGNHIGHLDREDMAKVDRGLLNSLGLKRNTINDIKSKVAEEATKGINELASLTHTYTLELGKLMEKMENFEV